MVYTKTILNNYTTDSNKIINYYLKADLCLIILKNIDIFKTVIPSKHLNIHYLKRLYYTLVRK